jgi:hypothetical protein
VYVLPDRESCDEAFGWLVQYVRQSGGEALVMRVDQFVGLTDTELVARFDQARQGEYAELAERISQLEAGLDDAGTAHDSLSLRDELDRLQHRYADVARIDYFQSAPKLQLAARLARARRALLADSPAPNDIVPASIRAYSSRRWVTRPHPHVDRLACAWLIRRRVDSEAAIRYASDPKPDEVAFDMPDAEFSHQGNLCTIEVMIRAFDLHDDVLQALAEIVHEIDLRDGMYAHPETSGVDALLRGWQLAGLPDKEMEVRGLQLFDGLYAALADGTVSE